MLANKRKSDRQSGKNQEHYEKSGHVRSAAKLAEWFGSADDPSIVHGI